MCVCQCVLLVCECVYDVELGRTGVSHRERRKGRRKTGRTMMLVQISSTWIAPGLALQMGSDFLSVLWSYIFFFNIAHNDTLWHASKLQHRSPWQSASGTQSKCEMLVSIQAAGRSETMLCILILRMPMFAFNKVKALCFFPLKLIGELVLVIH